MSTGDIVMRESFRKNALNTLLKIYPFKCRLDLYFCIKVTQIDNSTPRYWDITTNKKHGHNYPLRLRIIIGQFLNFIHRLSSTILGSNPSGLRHFLSSSNPPDRHWNTCSLLFNNYPERSLRKQSSPGVRLSLTCI
jgi:hypothetical protein